MSMVFCRGCGKSIHESAPICPHCGASQQVHAAAAASKPTVVKIVVAPKPAKPMPDGIKGWSWGGFLLNWIWAIGNNTWIGLLALVPVVGIVMSVVLGIKGREWAWQNKQWESLEHFNRVQRKWSMWGAIVVGGIVVIAITAAIAIPAYKNYQEKVFAKQQEIERLARQVQAELDVKKQAETFVEFADSVIFRAGKVEMVTGNDGFKKLLLNNRVITGADENEPSIWMAKIFVVGDSDVILLGSSTGGSWCPANYSFVTITKLGVVTYSDRFGTCSDTPKTTQDEGTITVTLFGFVSEMGDEADRIKAANEKHIFTYKNGEVSGS
ncbi:MAG: hypothetical protein WBL62_00500 [Gallionella sp.]